MTIAQEELTTLLQTMELEKKHESSYHKNLLDKSTIEEQKAKGVCWFPTHTIDNGYGMGYYPYVIIERKPSTLPHSFQSGKAVTLFSNSDRKEMNVKGIIQYVNKDKMKITIYENDLPDWMLEGKIGVQLLFDENSYKEMENAVKKVLDAEKGRLAELRELLLGQKIPQFNENTPFTPSPILNDSQNQAVKNILQAQDVAIIHGPPGTGKTTTLVQAIKQLIAQGEKQILVCAGSNSAVDFLTEKLVEQGVNTLRIGNLARIDEQIWEHTIEGKFMKLQESKEIRNLKRQAHEYKSMANKYKRTFTKEDADQRKRLRYEAQQLIKEAVVLEEYCIDKIVGHAQVITCTLVGAVNKKITDKTFNTVIIDEAAQCLEPACWIPITKAQRVILAGDPYQLPPTVKSTEAQKAGLHITLLEKCIQRLPSINLLDTQYRMHETIMGFSNQWFYNNQLKAADAVRYHALQCDDNAALTFIDTAGCGFEEKLSEESFSYYNANEWELIQKHLNNFYLYYKDTYIPTIAIISPYREQVEYMREFIDPAFLDNGSITINTIDSFQGQERDIVYLSLVRSNEKQEIGFLMDYRRMNVAMTRAKKKLIIIGDSATLGNNKFYNAFLEYCEKNNSYHTAWEWM